MLKRTALRLSFSFAVLILSSEILLQAVGFLVPTAVMRAGHENSAAPPDAITVLCVGDSHTYGTPLPEEEAYPAQLEDHLNSRAAGERSGERFRVVNLGLPGQNTAMVAHRLGEQIDRYDPRLLIVWAGLNNIWNPDTAEADGERGALRRWLLKSKVLRLVMVSLFREDGIMLDPASAREQRIADYSRIAAIARERQLPMIFISYPVKILSNQAATNDAIRAAAERFGVPVVASFDAYMRAVKDGYGNDELLVSSVGPHPSGLLYRYVVEMLAPIADRLLAKGPRS